MAVLPFIYLGYMFLSLYMLSLFLLVYFRNRKNMFEYPKAKKQYSVSFIVPAYNEGGSIEDSIKHIFSIDYKNIREVIVINDASTDNTKEILKKLVKKYPKLKVITNKKNLGNAARSQNAGLKHAKGEIIAVVDADSFPAKDSLKKMLGFFDDPKVGAVTVPVLGRNRNKFIEELQALEYKVIAFTRKLLDYLDAVYVTPGPLALYRRKALEDIKGFDEKNMTQDIEATWHLAHNGWDRRMCLNSYVASTVPSKFWGWFKQRRRWNIGGLQCIGKYRKSLFRKGIFGWFIIPLFVVSTFLGLLGLSIFVYLMASRVISRFLLTRYSIVAGTAVLTLDDFYITLNILNYLGIILFFFGLIFTIVTLKILNEKILRKKNILTYPVYLIIYLAAYPLIMVDAIIHLAIGKYRWR